jgi:hypothetical protein
MAYKLGLTNKKPNKKGGSDYDIQMEYFGSIGVME